MAAPLSSSAFPSEGCANSRGGFEIGKNQRFHFESRTELPTNPIRRFMSQVPRISKNSKLSPRLSELRILRILLANSSPGKRAADTYDIRMRRFPEAVSSLGISSQPGGVILLFDQSVESSTIFYSYFGTETTGKALPAFHALRPWTLHSKGQSCSKASMKML